MQTFLEQWLMQMIFAVPNFLTAVLIFLVSLYFAGLLSRLLKNVLERRRVVSHITNLLSQLIYWTVIVIGVITALQRFFDVTAFLAGLGILGFTVGFALQDVMKNFAAGIVLLLQQPFRVGEAISVANYDGTIFGIDLRATEMKTFDGRVVTLPNATVLTNAIVNYTRAYRRRVDLPLEVSPGADPETIRKIVLEIVPDIAGFVSEPAPMVAFQQISGSSIGLTGYFWIDVTKANPVEAKDTALLRIKTDFERRGITLSIPASNVYLHSEKEEASQNN